MILANFPVPYNDVNAENLLGQNVFRSSTIFPRQVPKPVKCAFHHALWPFDKQIVTRHTDFGNLPDTLKSLLETRESSFSSRLPKGYTHTHTGRVIHSLSMQCS